MDFYERRRPPQEPRRDARERRRSTEEKFTQTGDALLVWLTEVVRLYGREEAFDLFLNRVKQEQIRKETVQSALSRAGGGEAFVIYKVVAVLDRTSPPFWK